MWCVPNIIHFYHVIIGVCVVCSQHHSLLSSNLVKIYCQSIFLHHRHCLYFKFILFVLGITSIMPQVFHLTHAGYGSEVSCASVVLLIRIHIE